jgi:hypothetical protein
MLLVAGASFAASLNGSAFSPQIQRDFLSGDPARRAAAARQALPICRAQPLKCVTYLGYTVAQLEAMTAGQAKPAQPKPAPKPPLGLPAPTDGGKIVPGQRPLPLPAPEKLELLEGAPQLKKAEPLHVEETLPQVPLRAERKRMEPMPEQVRIEAEAEHTEKKPLPEMPEQVRIEAAAEQTGEAVRPSTPSPDQPPTNIKEITMKKLVMAIVLLGAATLTSTADAFFWNRGGCCDTGCNYSYSCDSCDTCSNVSYVSCGDCNTCCYYYTGMTTAQLEQLAAGPAAAPAAGPAARPGIRPEGGPFRRPAPEKEEREGRMRPTLPMRPMPEEAEGRIVPEPGTGLGEPKPGAPAPAQPKAEAEAGENVLEAFPMLVDRGLADKIKESEIAKAPFYKDVLLEEPKVTAEDAYRMILGLEPNFTLGDQLKAYKKLSLKWHPDKNPGNEEYAKQVFQLINIANEGLETAAKHKMGARK